MATATKKDEKADEKAAEEEAKAAEKQAKADEKAAEEDVRTQKAESDAEVLRAHRALAEIRKLAVENVALTPGQVVDAIQRSGVDTSGFDKLAAGV